MQDKKYTKPEFLFLNFADNKIPEFKELKSKDWIICGKDNDFPQTLLYLYNKSSNHNAIINGKVHYISGAGFPENHKLEKINSFGESLNKVTSKFCTDIELFGGCYAQVVWKKAGGIELYHTPYHKIRKGKDSGYWYKDDWRKSIEPTFIPAFDPKNKTGKQILEFKEYRAGCDYYPLPYYFGALNDIETDVEISKYNLSVIKNGMFSSKMIVFNNGVPADEIKRQIEKDFEKKFTGSENSGKFMLVFNNDPAKAPTVQDLSTTDLDKLFEQLNKTVQQEIFSGHGITSPLLFGISQPGAMGNRNEIQDAYEIFKNTYVSSKQKQLNEFINILTPYLGVSEKIELQDAEPIGFKLSDDKMVEIMPKEWIYEKLGIDVSKYPSLQQPSMVPGTPAAVNENVKNMTGRQFQNLNRLVTKYRNGKMDRASAALLLRESFGLGDEDIEVLLGECEEFEKEFTENEVAEMFAEIGTKKDEFVIIKSRPAKFSLNGTQKEIFKDIKQTDSNILDLIRKDKRITPAVIGKTLNLDPYYVAARIKTLEESGVLKSVSSKIGVDTIIEHSIIREQIDTIEKPETIDVYVKYAYEAKPGLKPIIETTRPFCRRLIELDRLYTRSEIESITQRVGYSVFDRKGGFWGSKDECRHRWVSHVVIKKKVK